MMKTVILSGGSGSRLWPVSRESYPKQFCEFFDKSFLRETVERLNRLGDIHIITHESMGTLTKNAVATLGVAQENILLEPYAKNTAPAVALAVHLAQLKNQGEEVMGVFPADHLISQVDFFQRAIQLSAQLAEKNEIVVLGIEPRFASTGYGYLETISSSRQQVDKQLSYFKVANFVEKPDQKKADAYFKSGNFYWNAGIFIFKINRMAELFEAHMPEMWRRIKTILPDMSNIKSVYANVLSQSLDYGVMEKIKNQIICIPGNFGWSDVGSWDELARLQEESLQMDSQAHVFNVDAVDNFVYSSHEKVVGLCGVEGLIIAETPDALLVAKKGQSQKVKDLVVAMREAKLPQVDEHNFEIRPWGKFELLADCKDHKVKRLTVSPHQQLSFQQHQKRDEHWVVVSGKAEVRVEDKRLVIEEGQQIFVARGQKHRIRNIGEMPLVIIEVQTGQYFGEDDIVRFEDDYSRV